MSWFPDQKDSRRLLILLFLADGQSKPMFGPWSDENQLLFKGFQGLKASCITIITIMHYHYLQNCFVRSYSWKHIRRKRNEGGCFTFGHINHNQAQLDVFLRTFCHFRTPCVHLSNCCHCRSDWMRVHNRVKGQHQKNVPQVGRKKTQEKNDYIFKLKSKNWCHARYKAIIPLNRRSTSHSH